MHPRTKKVSLQDRISDWSKGLQNASPSELTSEESQTLSLKANDRPLPFSGISGDPVTIFRTRDRCVRSVIEADDEHPHCQEYRDWIYNRFKDTVFKEGGNHWSEIEKNMDKRGPNGICVLEPIPDAKPKADKPIRAVGLREEAMREKIKEFQEKGWIVPSQSHWVSRGFLVPKPGTNKWRLVIDYRYVNTQLRGCEFPLPVIEDLFVKQAGNQLWTLLDLEDGFRQMPLSECSRQYTAFCTPFGVFEWRVLPVGVKVGPQAFQRMVSDCLKSWPPVAAGLFKCSCIALARSETIMPNLHVIFRILLGCMARDTCAKGGALQHNSVGSPSARKLTTAGPLPRLGGTYSLRGQGKGRGGETGGGAEEAPLPPTPPPLDDQGAPWATPWATRVVGTCALPRCGVGGGGRTHGWGWTREHPDGGVGQPPPLPGGNSIAACWWGGQGCLVLVWSGLLPFFGGAPR